MKDKFIKFLKKQNAFDDFCRALREGNLSDPLDQYLKQTPYALYVSCFCMWDEDTKGFCYWDEISALWKAEHEEAEKNE